MEIRKIFTALAAAVIAAAAGSLAYAADNEVYTCPLSGAAELSWGHELYTKTVIDIDISFKGEGAGITLVNRDGTKDGTSIRAVDRDGTLTLAADGGTGDYYIYYIALDTEKTYHLNIIGTWGAANGIVDMRVDTYAPDGTVETSNNYYMILMNQMYASSGVGPAGIRVEENTEIKNLSVTELIPDSIKLVSPPKTVTPGSRTRLDVKAYRAGEVLDYPVAVTYSAEGGGAAISADGVLEVPEDAAEGTVRVFVSPEAPDGEIAGDMTEIGIITSDIFTINTAVFNESKTELEAVNAVKNYFYDGTAAFVVSAYDESGILRNSFVKYVPAKALPSRKETPVVIGYAMPDGYNDDWTIEIDVYSRGGECDVFTVSGDVGMRKTFTEHGGAVEWLEKHDAVAGMLNGKTVMLQLGNGTAYIDGAPVALATIPYLVDDYTYIGSELIEAMIE